MRQSEFTAFLEAAGYKRGTIANNLQSCNAIEARFAVDLDAEWSSDRLASLRERLGDSGWSASTVSVRRSVLRFYERFCDAHPPGSPGPVASAAARSGVAEPAARFEGPQKTGAGGPVTIGVKEFRDGFTAIAREATAVHVVKSHDRIVGWFIPARQPPDAAAKFLAATDAWSRKLEAQGIDVAARMKAAGIVDDPWGLDD